MRIKYLLLGLFTTLISAHFSYANCGHPDYVALAALYNATDGDNWTNTTNNDRPWDVNNSANCDPCSWYGVGCQNGRVTSLDLWENNLFGTLPTEIGDLVELTFLSFGRNNLDGAIPSTIGNLIHVRDLRLNNNQFTSLPAEIGNMTALRFLYVGQNNLTSTIPEEIGNLHNLEVLRLQNNPNLGGMLPESWGYMASIREISLHDTNISGCFPASFTLLCQTNVMTFFGNTNLTEQDFSKFCNNNSGACAPPACPVIDPAYHALVALYKATNGDNWTNKTNWDITGVDCDPCNWHGITCSGGGVFRIDLNNNNLQGPIPKSIGTISTLIILDLSNNQLAGGIPTEITNLPNLSTLNLSNNPLGGAIPTAINQLSNLRNLLLTQNQLSGDIPSTLWSLASLELLILADNQLTGTISDDVGMLTNLRSLVLFQNQLTGTIPSTIGNLQNLTGLDLSVNQLQGNLPNTLLQLSNLESLELSINQLSGNLPSGLGSLTKLTSLGVWKNQLSGIIPSELGNLTNLTRLTVGDNNFTAGPPPSELGNLTKLTRLWMDHMQMTGEIPPFLNRLTALTDLQLDNNNLTGCIPNELKFLCTNNANVDISNNQLNNNDFSTFCTNDIGNCGSMNPTCHPSLTLSASRNNDSTFAASTTITSTDTLNNPHTFVYKAGQAIQLLAGFQVQVGATFSAIIEDCSSTLQETELPINAFIQPAIATDVVEDLSLKVYPNPFYHLTTIQFTMKHQSPIQLNLYNLNGQTVKTMIHSSNYAAGIHQLNLDRQDLPKGIYLLSLQTATEQLTQKISIL